MSFISVTNLSFQAGTKSLFEELSFSIEQCDRIGLVGHNGCGKSTLLKLLEQVFEPDAGQITVQRGLKTGLVEQFLPPELDQENGYQAVLKMIPVEDQVILNYQVETLLSRLGFDDDLLSIPMASLSGGQKNLILLARAIIQSPELLLLDEPGNHMDNRAMVFLKRYLQSPDAPAFLMISHDRDLLDSTTSRTLWLRDQRCYAFNLPYFKAKEALEDLDEAAAKAREVEEKQISKLKVSAKRLATWGKVYDNEDLSRKAKTMERRIEKLEADKTFVTQGSGLSLAVDSEILKAKQLFTIEDALICTPDKRRLFSIDYLTFKPGDRIALLGVNGSGKSTFIEALIKSMEAEANAAASIRFNPNVRLGYFDQELAQFESNESIFEWAYRQSNVEEETIKRTLIHWGFSYQDHSRVVNVLSGGERARLLLMTFQMNQPNLLIMDEPTNHIDLQGKESLEQDLVNNGVSLLFTSHDQRFIQTVANRFWWIHDGQLTELHDSDRFFEQLNIMPLTGNPVSKTEKQINSLPTETIDDEETVLSRIVELETLLEQDLARKSKFQKQEKQKAWQEEIDQLYLKMS